MPLKVSLVSADAEVWSGEASLVVAKTVEGEIGFMSGHEPVLGDPRRGSGAHHRDRRLEDHRQRAGRLPVDGGRRGHDRRRQRRAHLLTH